MPARNPTLRVAGVLTMSVRPRTGVLTFHRCINYGSYWQARCLVEGLRARGHDTVLIDHTSRRANLAEWRCALQPVLPTPVPRRDYVLYGLKMAKFFRAFAFLPCSRRFELENPEQMEPFERVVVGSDEVWNLTHPWYGGCGLFYGDRVRAGKLISYAASFGNYPASWGLEPAWAERLKRFQAISVRDENSWWLVRNEVGVEPDVVLDPCLQFPPRPKGGPGQAKEPYVAVYGHNFSEAFSREVRRWARSCGLPLVSIGYRNAWADRQWITAGPHDFARFIARAAAVATNFFHGCVFALLNGRPFACESTSYRSNKVQGLMAQVGAEAHLMGEEASAEQYDTRLGGPLAPAIQSRIEELRRASGAYLDRALA